MEPSLQPVTPTGAPTKFHVAWSINMTHERATGIAPAALARLTGEALTAMGARLLSPPEGHVNPESTRAPVGAGTGHDVYTVEAWFTPTRGLSGRDVNTQVATAFRNAGGGSDFPVSSVSEAMATCATLREVSRQHQTISQSALEVVVPGLSVYRDLFQDIGACCATYEAFRGDPHSNVSVGLLGRAFGGPVEESNNPDRIGESPVLFTLGGFDITSTQAKIAAGVLGAVVLMVAAGYFLRSVKVVTL